MTRKTLVSVVALIYMVVGFLNFYYSLFPKVSPSGLLVVRAFPLVGGALAFFAGLSMFRLSEFGRKFVILLLSIRIVINIVFLLRLPSGIAGLGIQNRLGEINYRIQSPYAYQGFLLAWVVIALLTIVFLSQKATKEVFVPPAINEPKPDIILEE